MATAVACQRKGYGTTLLKILQAYVNDGRIYVEISGRDVPSWWCEKGFVSVGDVSVKPKLWPQSKVVYWSSAGASVADISFDGSTSLQQPVAFVSKPSSAKSASSQRWNSRDPVSPPATPAASSRGTVAAACVESCRRSLLCTSPTASNRQNGAQPRGCKAHARCGPGRDGTEASSSTATTTSSKIPNAEESDTSVNFIDSWAAVEGLKTRELFGIHLAKENETPRKIAKQHNIAPELLLEQNADWYPQLQLAHKLKAATVLQYWTSSSTDAVLEGTVLGPVDPSGDTSPFWRVEYPVSPSATKSTRGTLHHKSVVLERSLEEVRAGCWAWEAHYKGWILTGNQYINEIVAKRVDIETHSEVHVDTEQDRDYNNDRTGATRRCSWKWVIGQVVGFGGEDVEDLDEHGDQVWRVHYDDFDFEDLNKKQLVDGMQNAKAAQEHQMGSATTHDSDRDGRISDAFVEATEHRHKKQRYLEHDIVEAVEVSR
jgi:hypothetical protein